MLDEKNISVLNLVATEFISVNHYLAYRTIMKNGKPMAMSYKTKEATNFQKKFMKHVEEQIKLQNWKTPVNSTQHFYVDAIFYFPRIDMDANNYWKCSLDAITETQLIWADDNVVCERVNRIYYNSINPRIEFKIYPVEYKGIFDSLDDLNQFEGNCECCKRHSNNCSILIKAKEGRIQEDINDKVCSKFKPIK